MIIKPPQVNKLLTHPELEDWNQKLLPSVRAFIVRKVIAEARDQTSFNQTDFTESAWIEKVRRAYQEIIHPSLTRAINATGIVLHTNLGRAPIGTSSLKALQAELSGYCTLETDIETGKRGNRTDQVENMICALTGAEAALVVNNGASAVFLVLNALSMGRETLISRGELVQIGGGFRIPDILKQSGATLCEIGTTNITELSDYQKAVCSRTALILKVHQSCFHIQGHTHAPSLSSLSELASDHQIPLAVDWGSGSIKNRSEKEISITEILESGCDLLSFSGDKLFGASQAGILVGKRLWIDKLRKSPLCRALRLGKLDLFVLEDRLRSHLAGKPSEVDSMLEVSFEALKTRTEAFSKTLNKAGIASQIKTGLSPIGGGSTPDEEIESCLLEIAVSDCEGASRTLSQFKVPVFVRKEKGKLILDLRTVFIEQEPLLLEALLCLS